MNRLIEIMNSTTSNTSTISNTSICLDIGNGNSGNGNSSNSSYRLYNNDHQ